jgi:hypothetical protein
MAAILILLGFYEIDRRRFVKEVERLNDEVRDTKTAAESSSRELQRMLKGAQDRVKELEGQLDQKSHLTVSLSSPTLEFGNAASIETRQGIQIVTQEAIPKGNSDNKQ